MSENKKVPVDSKVQKYSVQQILVSHEKRIQELEQIIREMKNEQTEVRSEISGNTFVIPTPSAPSMSSFSGVI